MLVNKLKVLYFVFGMIFLSSCTGKQIIVGAAQFETNKHCDNDSDISYLRCGINIESEYEKNKALHEQVIKEAEETKE